MNKPIHVKVAVHLVGQPEGAKNFGGILEHQGRDLEVLCLPAQVPSRIDVDVSHLLVGQSLHVRDLAPAGYQILDDPTKVIAQVARRRLRQSRWRARRRRPRRRVLRRRPRRRLRRREMARNADSAAPAPSFLVLGLGNPGDRYEDTRHNLGFRVVERVAASAGAKLAPGPGPYRLAHVSVSGTQGLIAEPTTYMNRAGVAAGELRRRFAGVEIGRLLAVCDDIDLPLGRVRFRPGGGDGGHKGLRSMIEELGTGDFPRLRLGIGRPQDPVVGDVVEHVLEPFGEAELESVEEMVSRAAQGVRVFVCEGILAAMNRFNAASLDPPGAGR
jgi:PTH1 family peptidyl-tRNA hydrolase